MAKEDNPQDKRSKPNGSDGRVSPIEHRALILHAAKPLIRPAKMFGMEPEDVIQAATENFIRGSDTFDPTRGELSTFMMPTIQGGVKRELRDRGWLIKVPRSVKDNLSRVSTTVSELKRTLGRAPTDKEVAEHLEINTKVVKTTRRVISEGAVRPIALLASDGDTDDPHMRSPSTANPERVLVDERAESAYDTSLTRMMLKDALASLPPRQRRITHMHFGLNAEGREMSQMEIAEEEGISQMHVSRLLNKSLEQLRRKMGA